MRIVALGDSLTAGYGLKAGEDYPSRLQAKLIQDGLDVKIENAGVSGDTTAGGLSRLDWAVGGDPAPALAIVALGANDMLRALDPATTEKNLRAILNRLKEKKIPALLYGMKAPLNLEGPYRTKFEKIYPDLAKDFQIPLYPFFLDGVAMNANLNQADGLHPTAQGVEVIVAKTAPVVERILKKSTEIKKAR